MQRAYPTATARENTDEDSGDIQEHAYEMGYADRGQTFDFARAYGAVNLKLRAAYPRYKRLNQLLDRKKGILTRTTWEVY